MSQPSVRKIKTVNWLRLYHKLTFIFVIINDFITLNNFFDTLLFVKIVSEISTEEIQNYCFDEKCYMP